MRIAITVLSLATMACSKLLGIGDLTLADSSSTPDIAIDVPASCAGVPGWAVCFAPEPTESITLPTTINTATSPLCKTPNATSAELPDSCVIAGDTVTASGTIHVTGPRPLIVYGTTTITIAGGALLDAGSTAGNQGPSAQPTGCSGGSPAGTDALGSGGGAGGTFGSIGGSGGRASGVEAEASTKLFDAVALHAGCAGTSGGNAVAANGGLPGGAIYLVSKDTIDITGTIDASGAGGRGARNGGGGGGGSGGTIAVVAPVIRGTGVLVANGGGGAGGGVDDSGGLEGSPGKETDFGNPALAPPGGLRANPGGDGGQGASRDSSAGGGQMGSIQASSHGSGGGGGGGGGIIHLFGKSPGQLTISPAPKS